MGGGPADAVARHDPHDVLRIQGREAAAAELLTGFQQVFGMNRIAIDDKHFELIIRRMLSLVEIVEPNDSGLRRGDLVEQGLLLQEAGRIRELFRIEPPGAANLPAGRIVTRKELEAAAAAAQACGQPQPLGRPLEPATYTPRLSPLNVWASRTGWSQILAGVGFPDGAELAKAALCGERAPLAMLADRCLLSKLRE